MSIEKSGCERFCQKTGECLLDKISRKELRDSPETEEQLIKDLKVAFPKRVKAFKAVQEDTYERLNDEFKYGDPEEVGGPREETFVWDSVKCAYPYPYTKWIGTYAINTDIYLEYDDLEDPTECTTTYVQNTALNVEPLDHTITREEYELYGGLPAKAIYREV